MCKCRNDLQNKLSEKFDARVTIQHEMISGKTYSDFKYRPTGKSKDKKEMLFHSHCPWCGEEYNKKGGQNG
ncbi:MAG: hypothetical protein GY787_27525 [Alteromonadales bacterium]|nr:hypothetical protein [Alteromonadales bacterium]